MNRDDIIKAAKEVGLVAEPCVHQDYIAIRGAEAPDSNERMRFTADGQVLIVDEGFYWQIGTVNDVAEAIRGRKA